MPVNDVKQTLTKSAAWHEARRQGIGGSDAGRIMMGDWLALWEEKTGKREPEDLSDNLAVAMGTWTESLNRYWYERATGSPVSTKKCGGCVHPEHKFMRANLDGRINADIFEAKHVNAFTNMEELYERYTPQCQHNLAVTGAQVCHLSVFFGSARWETLAVKADRAYQKELIEREQTFWRCVLRKVAPPSPPDPIPPPPIDEMRVVDMSGDNAWGVYASDWLENRDAAKIFDAAKKGLKERVKPDVRLATGFGVQVKRTKSGALAISTQKEI
ncbi:MAG: YqaJ viral recombinase family protein [Pseudomonadota bacterium]